MFLNLNARLFFKITINIFFHSQRPLYYYLKHLHNDNCNTNTEYYTFAQILAALTTGNLASALGATVILIPGNIFCSLSWYFSATPTVSTYT